MCHVQNYINLPPGRVRHKETLDVTTSLILNGMSTWALIQPHIKRLKNAKHASHEYENHASPDTVSCAICPQQRRQESAGVMYDWTSIGRLVGWNCIGGERLIFDLVCIFIH